MLLPHNFCCCSGTYTSVKYIVIMKRVSISHNTLDFITLLHSAPGQSHLECNKHFSID